MKTNNDIIEAPITRCEKCNKLYLKFEHIPYEQPCPHCPKGDKDE